ncbi:MAG: hypothetical protein SNJ57_10895 [Cyanobacteriota bacterium]
MLLKRQPGLTVTASPENPIDDSILATGAIAPFYRPFLSPRFSTNFAP